LVARVADRLLAGPERAILPVVPDLAQEAADRVLGLAQAASQANAVAEARRVPEEQAVAVARLDEHVRVGGVGDVRRGAHLADVAPEQRARERRLARVGVRDEAE